MSRFLFPKWSNALLPLIAVVGATVPIYVLYFVAFGFSPKTLEVGYQPVQPVPFSHALHAGELGMDCRYCHNTVERADHAAIPATQTCMNCHTLIKPDSPKLEPVQSSYEDGLPIQWTKVNHVADYSYFSHQAHVNRGVGCVSCHGRIDQMEVVYQAEPLSMGWCLDCHRNPEPNLRPVSELTNMSWGLALGLEGEAREKAEAEFARQRLEVQNLYHINPSENCSTCHR
ncbi:MAG TPA: cytochrome C [Phycisphaerales bacterium]|nr:cytochrome C [Phycisphaerales bacterium]